MMSKKFFSTLMEVSLLILSVCFLMGCNKSANKANPTPTITVTPTKEATVTPTATPTPTPEPVAEPTPEEGGLTMTLEVFPRIDGATALAPFYEAVAAKILGMPVEDARMFVQCNTTGEAYQNLIDGKVDMIFCALPSEDQIAAATEAGVEFSYQTILNGGFVFFVNKDNPVDSLTVEQLQGIYSGKITNWKEVGGDDVPIVAYQRNEGSGSQTGLYRYVLPKEKVAEAPMEHYVDDMMGAVNVVSAYDNGAGAICYSYYYYVANMYNKDQIKLIGVNGVIPSFETIAEGQYPFLNFSQVIIRSDTPKDSNVYKIIDWILEGNGDGIAEELGYVPNHIKQD